MREYLGLMILIKHISRGLLIMWHLNRYILVKILKYCFLQYVSVRETLKALLSHESMKAQYTDAKVRRSADPNILQDVRDGRNFKEKDIFQQCMSSVSIILYQDSFEVANPLGSGRKNTRSLLFTCPCQKSGLIIGPA